MATDVPQRALRNETAALLRRVEAGERLRVTVQGHPVAELVPLGATETLVDRDAFLRDLGGLLRSDDPFADDLRRDEDLVRDPFE